MDVISVRCYLRGIFIDGSDVDNSGELIFVFIFYYLDNVLFIFFFVIVGWCIFI